MNGQLISVFMLVFVLVTLLGFWAARWRAGNMSRLQEWGLAGRRFGGFTSWFLMGGDIYTAYSFISIPGLIFGKGALGLYFIPYNIISYVLFFIFLPRFWTIARHRGYITPADFVRERFGSKTLALLVSCTSILAVLPYLALQLYGMEVCIAQMGIPVELSLFIAFFVLTLYTYFSGLRAPAMIAIVKDILIWLVIIVAVVSLTIRLGGLEHIFAQVPKKMLLLSPDQYSTYATLALGSGLGLFLYPHTLTGMFSTNSQRVVARNAAFLPAYVVLNCLIALLGYIAISIHIKPSPIYGANSALPSLFASMFPAWFTGVAFAAIAVGALVPAAVMSIACANLFTRNIYREYFRSECTEKEEATVAKIVSLVVKFGALAFVLLFPPTFSINFQLLGGIWILNIFPAVYLGLYTNWFHKRALIIGWAAGMIIGTWLALTQNFASVYPLKFGPATIPVYSAVIAFLVNITLSYGLTLLFKSLGVAAGRDATRSTDFEERPVAGIKLPPFAPQPAIADVQLPFLEGNRFPQSLNVPQQSVRQSPKI